MPKPSPPQNYKLLARYYDDFFTFHQEGFRRARAALLGDILPRVNSACDLACGTGKTALEFAARGIKVFAVDLSPTMCRVARAKAARAKLAVTVLRGDMRDFALPKAVDLVLCEFDAINHVPEKSDFSLVARSVARALRPGGTFCFDVNNRKALQTRWGGMQRIARSGVILILWGGYDRQRERGWANAEWFIKSGSRWRRAQEHVEEVCWTPAEIRQGLRQAGFHRIRVVDGAPFFRGAWEFPPGCRTFYLAQKTV